MEAGARLEEVSLNENTVVARYALVDPDGTRIAAGGSIHISFEALDEIHRRLGGTAPLAAAERISMASGFLRPLMVASLKPAAPPARQDVTVNVQGAIARASVPPPKG
jgi:hypothetical protein